MGQEKCTIIQVTSHESSLNRYEETLRMSNERQSPGNTIYMIYFVGFYMS